MRSTFSLTLMGLLLTSAALADTYTTTTSELVYHGRGNRGYYAGYHTTTGTLIYRGKALTKIDLQETTDLPKATGLKAREIQSGLSQGSPLGRYKGPKTDRELNPQNHISAGDAAGALLSEQEPAPNPVATFATSPTGGDVPTQEETAPNPAADDMAPEAPPAPPEPEIPQ